jgi:hypothetical protein
MMRPQHLGPSFWPGVVLIVGLSACAERPLVAPANRTLAFDEGGGCEARDPELYGYVYEQGIRSARNDLTVTIDATDPETRARLKDTFPQSMWVNPGEPYPAYPGGRGFGWYDPRGGV